MQGVATPRCAQLTSSTAHGTPPQPPPSTDKGHQTPPPPTRSRAAAFRARSSLTTRSSCVLPLLLLTCALLLFCTSSPVGGATASQKVNQLNQLSKNGVVELDNESYEKYTEPPRSYGIVVLLTALSAEHACVPCREFDPEYRLVASSWSKQKKDDRLFFGSLEFKRGMDVYRKLGLTSAPSIMYFPPNGEGVKYELFRKGLGADALAKWLSDQIGQNIHVIRPINWAKYAMILPGTLLVLALGRFLFINFGYLLQLTSLWGAAALAMILTMCSGHMWNHIRNPPYAITGKDGKMEWIAGGFQQQFVMESQVFAILQAIAAISVVALAQRVPLVKNQYIAGAVALFSMAVLLIDISVMLWLFRMKNGGYPFKLFL